MDAIQQFVDEAGLKVYNKFKDVVDVVCRRDFISKFQKQVALHSELKISIPKTVFLLKTELADSGFFASVSARQRLSSLKFPVIVKPRISSILSMSHNLLIVNSIEKLEELIKHTEKYEYLTKDTIIVQEYIEAHYEQLIKLYAIGDRFEVVIKPTFPRAAIDHFLKDQGFLEIGQKNKFDF